MANHTLTYSETSQGWPSFYSYIPEYMSGMNNYFYSFSGGNIYQHNTNVVRNNYYGVQSYSEMTSVFNEEPLINKLFKTVNLESDQAWGASLETDIPNTGVIDLDWFVQKEGDWFGYIRSVGGNPAALSEYALRSMSGIAQSTSVTGTANTPIINFAINSKTYTLAGGVNGGTYTYTDKTGILTGPLTLGINGTASVCAQVDTLTVTNTVTTTLANTALCNLAIDIGSIISIGDMLYTASAPYTGPTLVGRITAVEIDIANNINRVTVDATIAGAAAPATPNTFILFIKNQAAESYGVLGHYMKFVLQNNVTTATELFAVESEVMKSNP